MEITRGKIQKPTKAVFYGPEGIGKSSLAAKLPNPVFTDVEGGTSRLDVARTPRPTSWAHFQQIVADMTKDSQGFQTWVIDTADWLEKLAIVQTCSELNISSLGGAQKGNKDAAWGASYNHLSGMWNGMLTQLEADFVDTGRMHIVFLAHSTTRKFELPEEEGAFDRYELAMEKKTGKSLREWADLLLFLNYQTVVNVTKEAKGNMPAQGKAQGGSRRMMFTEHAAAFDAKNRDGLPRVLDLDATNIMPAFLGVSATQQRPVTPAVPAVAPKPAAQPPAAPGLKQQHRAMQKLMADAGVTYEEVMTVVRSKKSGSIYPEGTPIENVDPAFIDGFINPHWERIKGAIAENKQGVLA